MAGFDPEAQLESLEPIGWRLGLERMHKLCALLGMPQHRFASIHVVGTNGKSSVTRMTAALLEAHGVSTGACVSPHPSRWSERVLIRGVEIGAPEFAAAVERAAEAAATVDRTLAPGESVTQFELATAAAFVAFVAAGVEAAVIEAGLGGRLDATNTIPSQVTALASVGLDHTRWLGESELEIATEKLAVLRDSSTLVLGRVSAEVEALAERTAAARGARMIRAPEDPGDGVHLRAPGCFQRRNFALAATVAEAFLGRLDPELVASVAATLTVPGRLEQLGADPPLFVDVAHNPDGAAALAEALPAVTGGLSVTGCLAILEDKDARAMIAALAPALEHAVCTEVPAPRPSQPAAELAAACAAAGLAAEAEPDFATALRRARALAVGPPQAALLVTGSHYVLGPVRAALAGEPLCEN
ncbi:MAG: bifunctional folylpolyglutamate synthase/dihydrofolate synthase [Solirubrobacterales bacterium]